MPTQRLDTRPVVFLLGKPVAADSTMAHVIERLLHVVPTITMHLARNAPPRADMLGNARIVVQRGLSASELDALREHEQRGVRFCNGIDANRIVLDRVSLKHVLEAANIPVPGWTTHADWSDVVTSHAGTGVVVKAIDGELGRGEGVLLAPHGDLRSNAPFAGPFLCENYVPTDGRDLKIYVAGKRVRGLTKFGLPYTRKIGIPEKAVKLSPSTDELARAVGSALGLAIYGVDILVGPSGPVVVDVNAFPVFRGVADGARVIAKHLKTSM